ncbi:MAG TPA: hypothetical protein VK619_18705 [Pyrinomonadaceae bacterium]|nr:hypothetical protein [Pyrinomonadaceae bacterium]
MENSENPSRAQLLLLIQRLEHRIQQLEDSHAKADTRLTNIEDTSQKSDEEIVWAVGGSSIAVKRDGIIFKAHRIDLSASGGIAVKAGGELVLKGAMIREN